MTPLSLSYYVPPLCPSHLPSPPSLTPSSPFQPPRGGSGDDISSVVEENRVPIPFLIILSLNFLLILVDRALYLRKTALWKLVFQYVLVVVVHGWLFFVLPAMTDR